MKASVVTRRAFLEDVEQGDVIKVGQGTRLVAKVVADTRVVLWSPNGLPFYDGAPHDVVTVYQRKDVK